MPALGIAAEDSENEIRTGFSQEAGTTMSAPAAETTYSSEAAEQLGGQGSGAGSCVPHRLQQLETAAACASTSAQQPPGIDFRTGTATASSSIAAESKRRSSIGSASEPMGPRYAPGPARQRSTWRGYWVWVRIFCEFCVTQKSTT